MSSLKSNPSWQLFTSSITYLSECLRALISDVLCICRSFKQSSTTALWYTDGLVMMLAVLHDRNAYTHRDMPAPMDICETLILKLDQGGTGRAVAWCSRLSC